MLEVTITEYDDTPVPEVWMIFGRLIVASSNLFKERSLRNLNLLILTVTLVASDKAVMESVRSGLPVFLSWFCMKAVMNSVPGTPAAQRAEEMVKFLV